MVMSGCGVNSGPHIAGLGHQQSETELHRTDQTDILLMVYGNKNSYAGFGGRQSLIPRCCSIYTPTPIIKI